MKKIIRLTESDLVRLVKRVLSEDVNNINPKNLKFGDKGPDVVILQKKLIGMGLLKTKSGKPTGYFGDLTKKALSTALGKTKTTSSYKISPRIDGELTYIKFRKLDDKPFFIYDPKSNLIYLYKFYIKFLYLSSRINLVH